MGQITTQAKSFTAKAEEKLSLLIVGALFMAADAIRTNRVQSSSEIVRHS